MIIKTWDLTHLCKNKEQWETYGIELETKIRNVEQLLSSILTVEDLKTCIQEKIEMDKLIERIYCYPRRMLDLNNQNEEAKVMFAEALTYYEKTEQVNATLRTFILKNEPLVKEFISLYPYYERYIEFVFKNKEHQVENEEAYTNLKKELENLKDIYRSLIGQDLEFTDLGETILSKKLSALACSYHQSDRKRAFEITMNAYERFSNTLATIYEKKIMVEEEMAHAKHFSSCLEEHLLEDELSNTMVSNLISVVRKNLSIEHEFMKLKKEALDLPEFHFYDLSISIIPELSKKIPLEEAYEILKQSFQILGHDYIKHLEKGFENGWLDLTISKTKRKDSFSCISYSGVPYTMLQYKENMDSLHTLAHESGHMVHTSYAKENEYEYFEYSLFLAEIASKVHETLLYHYLLEKSESKEETIYILEKMLSRFCTSLFSQTMLTEFELEVHRKMKDKEPVNADVLKKLYLSLANTYYGEAFTSDDLVGINFAKIPHFYLYPSYYVWQYSVGISIAHKIVADLIQDKNDMRKKYIEFLKIGNRLSVTDSLKIIGIDLENGTYIEDACEFINENMKVLKK